MACQLLVSCVTFTLMLGDWLGWISRAMVAHVQHDDTITESGTQPLRGIQKYLCQEVRFGRLIARKWISTIVLLPLATDIEEEM